MPNFAAPESAGFALPKTGVIGRPVSPEHIQLGWGGKQVEDGRRKRCALTPGTDVINAYAVAP